MLKIKIEALLFIANKPFTAASLLRFFKKAGEEGVTSETIKTAVEELKSKYNAADSGVRLLESGEEFSLVTAPVATDIAKRFVRDDVTGELTPASLETLTVIAYKGPIAKAELEQIRGVNCSMILRNLLIRGLINEEGEESKNNLRYRISLDFIKYLGVDAVEMLPDYERLSKVGSYDELLAKTASAQPESGQ